MSELVKALREEGWTVEYTDVHRVILGTGGAIYKNTARLLQDIFELPAPQVDKVLFKLSAWAVNKGQHTIRARRILEHISPQQWAGT